MDADLVDDDVLCAVAGCERQAVETYFVDVLDGAHVVLLCGKHGNRTMGWRRAAVIAAAVGDAA